jgi:hypothetical protein
MLDGLGAAVEARSPLDLYFTDLVAPRRKEPGCSAPATATRGATRTRPVTRSSR